MLRTLIIIAIVLLCDVQAQSGCDITGIDTTGELSYTVNVNEYRRHIISTPSGTKYEYKFEKSCTWKILARSSEIVYLELQNLKAALETAKTEINWDGGSGTFDLTITQKYMGTKTRQILSNLQDASDRLWISPGGEVILSFKCSRTVSNHYNGFTGNWLDLKIKYKIVSPLSACYNEVNVDEGTPVSIQLPNEAAVGKLDQKDIGCTWLLQTKGKNNLEITVNQNKGTVLQIHDGSTTASSILHNSKSDEESRNKTFTTSGNQALILWKVAPDLALIREVNVTAKLQPSALDCEFTEGFCHWKQSDEPTTDGRWKQVLGMMAEFILFENKEIRGTKANLISPLISTDETPLCVKISYYMYGEVAYGLKFLLHKTENNSQSRSLWSVKGSQGNHFIQAEYEIPSLTDGYLTLEAVQGYPGGGNMALDYVRSVRGKCTKVKNFKCDFFLEFCGWQQENKDLGNWQLMSIGELMSHSGSIPRLRSPVIQPQKEGHCVEIDISGSGSLTVYDNSSYRNTITGTFERSIKTTFSLNFSSPAIIFLEGRSHIENNLTISNIDIRDKMCSLDCKFSSKICSWKLSGSNCKIDSDFVAMRHLNSISGNQITSQTIQNLPNKYFCFSYTIQSTSPIYLELAAKFESGNFQKLWKQFGQKDENELSDCVRFPTETPYSLSFRSFTNIFEYDGEFSEEAVVKIYKVWTADAIDSVNIDCSFNSTLCGWHQPTYGDVIWMISPNLSGILAKPLITDKKSNSVAGYIFSPQLEKSRNGTNQCFQFSYVVYESSSGVRKVGSNILEVLVVDLNVGERNIESVWKQNLYSANSFPSKVSVTVNVPQNYQIVFGATLQDLEVSVHNITLSKACGKEFECSFNEGYCGWILGTNPGKYSWVWVKESSDPRVTGPVLGSDLKNGMYVVANSSFDGFITKLISPVQIPEEENDFFKNGQCFLFSYYMFGADVNELELHVAETKNKTVSPVRLWSKAGNQGNDWCRVQIPINLKEDFQVIFTSHRGLGHLGDIAVDDIKIMNEKCEEKEMCADEEE